MKIELIGEVADYYGEQKPDLAPLPKNGIVLSATEDELRALRFLKMQGELALVPAETPVDNSACRSALEEIQEKISTWCNDGTLEYWQYSQLWDIADAALAAPARNCDVYDAKTAEKEFVRQTGSKSIRTKSVRWLYAPANGGNGDVK